MAQTRIFVSHSSKDNDWARPFAAALTAIGYDVWYDETGLQGGAAWIASIQHEVEMRDIFVLVLTPEAWESKWVQDDLQLAIATRRRIIPVLLRNTQVSGFLLTTQWITVIGEEPQPAARAAVMAIEAPPAPGRNAAPVGTTETLDELVVLCRSLAAERRHTEALAACARALALDAHSIPALLIRARVFLQIDEPYKAVETCKQALLFAQGKEAEEVVQEFVRSVCWLDPTSEERSNQTIINVLTQLVSNLTPGEILFEVISSIRREMENLRQAGRPTSENFAGTNILHALSNKVQNVGVLREALALATARGGSEGYAVLDFAITYYENSSNQVTPADVEALRRYSDALTDDSIRLLVELRIQSL